MRLYTTFNFRVRSYFEKVYSWIVTLIARFMGPTWGPSGADRTQVGPMLAPWTLLSGLIAITSVEECIVTYPTVPYSLVALCIWRQDVWSILGHGLLPVGTKPPPEPMLSLGVEDIDQNKRRLNIYILYSHISRQWVKFRMADVRKRFPHFLLHGFPKASPGHYCMG